MEFEKRHNTTYRTEMQVATMGRNDCYGVRVYWKMTVSWLFLLLARYVPNVAKEEL